MEREVDPIREAQSRSAGTGRSLPAAPKRRTEPRVLIVDDARFDALALQCALAALGVRAAILPGFVRALVRVRCHRDPLEQVICVIEGPEGLAFLREASRLRRDVRFVGLALGGPGGHDDVLERLGRAAVVLDVTTPADEIAAAGRALLAIPSERPRPTILLVDGNPSQRRANQTAFRRLDHDCIGLSTAEQALALARREGVRLDAIVIASRPGGGRRGVDVARELSAIRPTIPCVVLRDHADDGAMAPGAVPVLERPYTPKTIAKHVIEMVRNARPSMRGEGMAEAITSSHPAAATTGAR